MTRFSTHLLDQALARKRERREQKRKDFLETVFRTLEELSREIPFEEAYIFGSLAKPYRYSEGSDVDIAFLGLKDEDFFRAMAFLSDKLGTDVDVLQLEGHRLRERILKEGIRWKRKG
jgi:hypothetical protein